MSDQSIILQANEAKSSNLSMSEVLLLIVCINKKVSLILYFPSFAFSAFRFSA